ncbi:unnamed protein product [Allacma fusca]|uniref:Uncharacterized protein n=1 Tax=Allacma fusca TaxID=39272 RepID=A0A8J2LBZ3_9HEXA|nr:unnamed protein product [Allacma fusca]
MMGSSARKTREGKVQTFLCTFYLWRDFRISIPELRYFPWIQGRSINFKSSRFTQSNIPKIVDNMVLASWLLKVSLWITMILIRNRAEARTAPYLETNEIVVNERAAPLPSCGTRSICGFLQANSRGINQERICNCENGLNACPMTWDPFDGHSVTQGSDQYKTCELAPTLKPCEGMQTAYTSRTVFSKTTDDILSKADYIKCICPDSHNYVTANQYFEDLDAETEAMEFTYVCAPLPVCQIGDTCKTISTKGPHFLVNRKCVCPGNQRCPTVTGEGVKSYEMGKGNVHLVHCQHPH